MGYNEGILEDEMHPQLPYTEENDNFLGIWKQPHYPQLWMSHSCVWYSQAIIQKLGLQKFNSYVRAFDYGNKDVSGEKNSPNGFLQAWLSSSLKISAQEQILFLQKLLDSKLPVSKKAHKLTKNILFIETLANNWKLYGKTGAGRRLNHDGSYNKQGQAGWFVGWITNDSRTILFAYYHEDENTQDGMIGQMAKVITKQKLEFLLI